MKICDRCKNQAVPVYREYECINDQSEIHLCAACAVDMEIFLNSGKPNIEDQPEIVPAPDKKGSKTQKTK